MMRRQAFLILAVIALGSFTGSCGDGETPLVEADDAAVSVAFDGETCS